MADLRGNKPTAPAIASFQSFSVTRDERGGYRVSLKWNQNDDSIVGFRIYRSKLSKSLLSKDYVISQLALERLTSSKNANFKSNILYNKSYFAQTNKVSFFKSDSERYNKKEEPISRYDYSQIAFVRRGTGSSGHFIDKGVRFGESYAYLITAVSRNMIESKKGSPLFVSIEDLSAPEDVSNFIVSEKASGILLQFSAPPSRDIMKYHIYREKNGDGKFEKIFEIPSTQSSGAFLDSDVIPGNEYAYKVYAEDFFGNISKHSRKQSAQFLSTVLNKGAIPEPYIRITFDNGTLRIQGVRNHQEIVGYRVERKDISNYEQNFAVRTYEKSVPQNTIFFSEDGTIDYVDLSAKEDHVYQYRISSISKVGVVESNYVTPPFVPNAECPIESEGLSSYNLKPSKILKFEAEVANKLQLPIFTKLSWEIEGDWSFVKIFIGNEEIVVDNIHSHIYHEGLSPGAYHEIRILAFGSDGKVSSNERLVRIRT